MTVTDKFKELVKVYSGMTIEFPHLKPITVAQWLLESGRGSSFLADKHNNFGGMMWRDMMGNWPLNVSKVRYRSPSDGIDTFYASFGGLADWIAGYWRFMDRPVYSGWREYAKWGGENYLGFIKQCGYAADPDYVSKVLALLPEAEKLIYNVKDDTHSEGETMPKVDIVMNSPNQSDRNGTLFRIVVHNTDASFSSALSWLCNPSAQVSAHLLIGRDGKVAQLVPFNKKAWHAGPANSQSIGIEIEATNNQKGMTPIQEKVLVEWLKYLMKQYGIKAKDIIGHREVMNTDCPGLIWPTTGDLSQWKNKNLTDAPAPDPDTKEVTWFDVFNLDGEVGIAAMAGSEAVAVLRSPTSLGMYDFLKKYGDHNVKHAPATKPWPGVKA